MNKQLVEKALGLMDIYQPSYACLVDYKIYLSQVEDPQPLSNFMTDEEWDDIERGFWQGYPSDQEKIDHACYKLLSAIWDYTRSDISFQLEDAIKRFENCTRNL